MIGNRTAQGKMVRSVLLAIATVLLSGCYDVSMDVDLHNDGSGTIAATSVMSKEVTDKFQRTGKGDDISLFADKNKAARVSRKIQNGRFTIIENLSFQKLSEVNLGDFNFEVIDLGRTFYGIDRSRIRWAIRSQSEGNEPKTTPKDAAEAARYKGYFFTLTMHLPCHVAQAGKLSAGGAVITPTIRSAFWNGSTVVWKVPMELIAENDNAKPRIFEVNCWSWYGIQAGKTR